MVDRRKTLHRNAIENPIRKPFQFMQNYIPYSSLIEQMGVRREPLPAFAPASHAAGSFGVLWNEIKTRVIES
jgi:hypothetical protein